MPFKVAGLDGIYTVQVAAGATHSVFLCSEGNVYTTLVAAMPVPVQIPKASKIAAGFNQSAAITPSGELYVWQQNEKAMNFQTITSSVIEVSLGRSISVALDSSGMLWTWGKNENGELGLNDTE